MTDAAPMKDAAPRWQRRPEARPEEILAAALEVHQDLKNAVFHHPVGLSLLLRTRRKSAEHQGHRIVIDIDSGGIEGFS